MIKLERGDAPSFWIESNIQKWTKRWVAKEAKANRWQWPTVEKQRINVAAVNNMKLWHNYKCAFCEGRFKLTIEHFKSKTRHPNLAYVWLNLLLACGYCNTPESAKLDMLDCIKPDENDPEQFLIINPRNCEVEARDDATLEQKRIVKNTIDRYDLNGDEMVKLREEHLKRYHQLTGQPIPIEKLRIMAQPDQPFSLLGKCLLRRYEINNAP